MIASTLSLVSPRQIQKTKMIAAGGQLLGASRRKWPFAVGKNSRARKWASPSI
jgi:hypothetical protein